MLVLLVLVIGGLATAAIARTVTWANSRAAAFENARKLIQSWEIEREQLVAEGVAAGKLKVLSSGPTRIETVSLPPKWKKAEMIRLPLFKSSSQEIPLIRWRVLERHATESGRDEIDLVHGNVRIESFSSGSKTTVLAATGAIDIEELDLRGVSHFEIAAGGNIKIGRVRSEGRIELLIHSITGEAVISEIPPDALGNCRPEDLVRIRTESAHNGAVSGCSIERNAEIWAPTEYLGEIELKSLIDSDKLR